MPSYRFLLFSIALAAGICYLAISGPMVRSAALQPPSKCTVLIDDRLAHGDFGPETRDLAARLRIELAETARHTEYGPR